MDNYPNFEVVEQTPNKKPIGRYGGIRLISFSLWLCWGLNLGHYKLGSTYHGVTSTAQHWPCEDQGQEQDIEGSPQLTDEHGHILNAIKFLIRKGRKKGSDRINISMFNFLSIQTCTYFYVWCFDRGHNLWSVERKELWTVTSHTDGTSSRST